MLFDERVMMSCASQFESGGGGAVSLVMLEWRGGDEINHRRFLSHNAIAFPGHLSPTSCQPLALLSFLGAVSQIIIMPIRSSGLRVRLRPRLLSSKLYLKVNPDRR